jgi:signal transduction histidine kinase
VEVCVSDTGAGIAPEIISRLGDAFALNRGVVGADSVKGAGLGLAICKEIAAAHGGLLEVRSEPGRGTAITVRLRADLVEPQGHGNEKVSTAP